MKKQTTQKSLDNFQDSTINTAQKNATTGGFMSFEFGFMGMPTKIMMGNMVLWDTGGNGNGVW